MVSFRADAELLRRIEAFRKSEDRKMADAVRRLVVRALDATERQAKKARAKA